MIMLNPVVQRRIIFIWSFFNIYVSHATVLCNYAFYYNCLFNSLANKTVFCAIFVKS